MNLNSRNPLPTSFRGPGGMKGQPQMRRRRTMYDTTLLLAALGATLLLARPVTAQAAAPSNLSAAKAEVERLVEAGLPGAGLPGDADRALEISEGLVAFYTEPGAERWWRGGVLTHLEAATTLAKNKDGRGRVMAFAGQTVLADPDAWQKLSAGDLLLMAGHWRATGRPLDALAEAAATKLHYHDRRKRPLARRQLDQLEELAGLSRSADLRRRVAAYRAAHADAAPAPFELAQEAEQGNEQAKRALARRIVDDYLQIEGLADALTGPDWVTLTRIVAEAGDGRAQPRMAAVLEERLEANRLPVHMLSAQDVARLRRAVGSLGHGRSLADLVLARWLGITPETLKSLDLGAAQAFASAVNGDASALKRLSDRYAALDDQQALVGEAYAAMIRAHLRLKDRQAARDWGQRLERYVGRVVSTMDREDLGESAQLLAMTGVRIDADRAGAVAERVASWDAAAGDVHDQTYAALAAVLNTDAGRAALEGALSPTPEAFNLSVAKALAWQAKQRDELRPLVRSLSIEAEAFEGDAQALRWLGVAYAASLLSDDPPRTAGVAKYVNQALEAASSEAMTLRAVDELVAATRVNGRHGYARDVIADVSPTLSDAGQAALSQRLAALDAMEKARRGCVGCRDAVNALRRRFQALREQAGAMGS